MTSVSLEVATTRNPECNAPLGEVYLQYHQEGAYSAADQKHEPFDSALLVHADAHARHARQINTLERFQRETRLRVAKRLAEKRDCEQGRQSAVRRNFERYLEQTQQYMSKFQMQQIRDIDRIRQSALQKEEQRISLGNAKARRALLAFCCRRETPEPEQDEDADTDMKSVKATSKERGTRPAFWDRGLHPSRRLSQQEKVRLSFRLRKWEMHEERQRARTEAVLRETKQAPKRRSGSSSPPVVPEAPVTSMVVRHTQQSESLKQKDRVRQYAERVRLHNRDSQISKPTRATKDASSIRRRLLDRVRRDRLEIPPLCTCGLTIFDKPDASGCANNCSFYRNPKAFYKALAAVYESLQNSSV